MEDAEVGHKILTTERAERWLERQPKITMPKRGENPKRTIALMERRLRGLREWRGKLRDALGMEA